MKNISNELYRIAVPRTRRLPVDRRGRAARAAGGPGRLAAATALMGLLLAARPSAAKEPHEGALTVTKASATDPKNAQLNALIVQGVEHYAAKRYKEAEALFLEVWRNRPSYDVAAKLGHAEYQLGKMIEAATHFSYALKNSPLTWKQEQRDFVEKGLAGAKAQVGTLILHVNRRDAKITIDGKPLGEALIGNEVFVTPGKHRIEAKLAGDKPAGTTIDVAKDASRVVALTLKPVEQRASSKNGALIVSGAAVSVAMVGAGVWLYVASASPLADKESLGKQIDSGPTKKDCVDDPNPLCAELSSALAKSDQLRNWGTAALITGGVLGAGTLVYSLWPSSKPEVRTGVRVLPVASGSTGGVAVLGRF